MPPNEQKLSYFLFVAYMFGFLDPKCFVTEAGSDRPPPGI
jgi:hypothetical protein